MSETTTRPVFTVNGFAVDSYDTLLILLQGPMAADCDRDGIEWTGTDECAQLVWRTWWGNTYTPGEPPRAAEGTGGLPMPLRPVREADEDAEADAALERIAPNVYQAVQGGGELGSWTRIYTQPNAEPMWVDVSERPDAANVRWTEFCEWASTRWITTRELRARLPLRDALGVECPACRGEGWEPAYGAHPGGPDERDCSDCRGTGRQQVVARVPQVEDAGAPIAFTIKLNRHEVEKLAEQCSFVGTVNDPEVSRLLVREYGPGASWIADCWYEVTVTQSAVGDWSPLGREYEWQFTTGRIDGARGEGEDYDGGRGAYALAPSIDYNEWVEVGPGTWQSMCGEWFIHASKELARRNARDTDATTTRSYGQRLHRVWLAAD